MVRRTEGLRLADRMPLGVSDPDKIARHREVLDAEDAIQAWKDKNTRFSVYLYAGCFTS